MSFPWFSVLKGVLSIAGRISKIMADRQLLEAGAAQAIRDSLYDAQKKVDRADRARRGVSHDPDSVHNDKANRDKWR